MHVTGHRCDNSCFCRMHGFALYFAPEHEELPEAGEHACIIPGCAVWAHGDKGAILHNERAGYVCDCESYAEKWPGHTIPGQPGKFHSVTRVVHRPQCTLFSPPCFDCFGYGNLSVRPGEAMGTVFRCPFHEARLQPLLERLKGAFIDSARGAQTPRNAGFSWN